MQSQDNTDAVTSIGTIFELHPPRKIYHAPYNTWHGDTGASHHVTANAHNLQHNEPYLGSDTIKKGNG